MLHQIASDDHPNLAPFLQALDDHLATRAVVAGDIDEGEVHVDDLTDPHWAIFRAGRRVYVAGDAMAAGVAHELTNYFDARWAGAGVRHEEMIEIVWSPAGWEQVLSDVLAPRTPLAGLREHYAVDLQTVPLPAMPVPPAGYSVHPADADLLVGDLDGLDALKEEMRSERATVEEFLARSFGVCLTTDRAIVGWCLSEYNTGDRCEVGIAIDPAHQRRGLGTTLALAFLVEARIRGVRRAGWHCWSSNLASAATARRAGLKKTGEHRVLYAFFDKAQHLAALGHQALAAGNFAAASEMHGRALLCSDAPAWAWFEAGCAMARLGDLDGALRHLATAISQGFRDREAYARSQHLTALRCRPEWPALVADLGQTE